MFKNKHVVIAMLVAPLLSIMAWFAVDYFLAERPHAAKKGAAYSLVAKSNCRYASGQCDLENSDFKISIRPVSVSDSDLRLEMTSAYPLQSATLGVVNNGIPAPPAGMSPVAGDPVHWTIHIDRPDASSSTLRLAVTADGSTWYAEIPVTFLLDWPTS